MQRPQPNRLRRLLSPGRAGAAKQTDNTESQSQLLWPLPANNVPLWKRRGGSEMQPIAVITTAEIDWRIPMYFRLSITPTLTSFIVYDISLSLNCYWVIDSCSLLHTKSCGRISTALLWMRRKVRPRTLFVQ
jgi:hypothetical protein